MKKILSIVSLLAVIVMLGTTLSSCYVITPSKNNSNTTNNSDCINCNDYEVGETFELDGVTYTVADRDMLKDALANGKDLSNFCTSKVTDMSTLFAEATSFNQDISNWDVSSVTNMIYMFDGATSFNQDIGNWDVSSVTNMIQMFEDATSFNQDLTQWCVSNIDSEPDSFSENSSLSVSNQPVWGTCP